jgi:hypothetical protein
MTILAFARHGLPGFRFHALMPQRHVTKSGRHPRAALADEGVEVVELPLPLVDLGNAAMRGAR